MVERLLGRDTKAIPVRAFLINGTSPSSQAQLTWSWSQWLCSRAVADGEIPLLMNLDETAVPLEFTFGRGNIIYKEKEKDDKKPAQAEGEQIGNSVLFHPCRNHLQCARGAASVAAGIILFEKAPELESVS